MNGQASCILLKLLSGANAGAEMELRPGDWMLGSDEESQLLLLDAGIRAQHLLLRVSAEGALTLVPKAGAVLVDGAPLPDEGAALPPFTLFTAGGVQIRCGPADEPWPDLALPLPAAGPEEPKAAPGDAFPAARADVSKTSANKVGTLPSQSSLRANKVGVMPGGRILAFVLLGLLLSFLILDFTHLGLFFSDTAGDASSLTRSLHRRGYDKVSATAQENGQIMVRGAVDSNTRMDALSAYLDSLPVKPVVEVVSAEDIATALRAQFKRADAALRVSRAGITLRISGYIYDMLALEELLLPEQKGLAAVPLRVDVVTWKTAENELHTLIGTRGLEQKIRLVPGLYHVALQAQPLSAQERQSLMVFLRQAEDLFGAEGAVHVERWNHTPPQAMRLPAPARVLRLEPESSTGSTGAPAETTPEATAAPVPDPVPQISDPLALQQFSCGSLRPVGEGHDMGVVLGGVVYRKGAKMPDGLQVKDINPDYVVLQRGRVFAHICTAREMAKE